MEDLSIPLHLAEAHLQETEGETVTSLALNDIMEAVQTSP